MSPDVLVKKSKINQKGVFANRDFRKGELVLKWNTDNVLTKEEVERLSGKDKAYVCPFHGKFLLQQQPARYVNHSCDPNTKVVDDSFDVAIKDIKKGEEITSDYSIFSVPGEHFKCNCGSRDCKGAIRQQDAD